MPDWYVNQPPVLRGDTFYLKAFWELSSCRQFGEFMGPIPWTVVVQYGERAGLDPGMIRVFEVVIRELDETYLTHIREDRDSRRGKALNQAKRARAR